MHHNCYAFTDLFLEYLILTFRYELLNVCSSLFETSQSLFWASFGLVDLMAFELKGIKSFTRFWALLMFGSYSVINIIVLLNMLIAMMSNSYQIISVSIYCKYQLFTISVAYRNVHMFTTVCEIWGSHGTERKHYCLLGCDDIEEFVFYPEAGGSMFLQNIS
jgi:hypothetical protein